MNLTNAILISLATATTTAAGSEIWQPATTIDARCVLDDVTRAQRVSLGAVLGDATAVLYVLKSAIAVEPTRGQKLVAAVNGSAAVSYRINFVRNREKDGGLAHWECFLQELPGGGA